MRILVAEDNLISQRLIAGLLANPRFLLTIVDNGREAVTAARGGEFDLILMDCRMPEMDGFEATGAIRDLPTIARRLPIIALTADNLPGDREHCLGAGMDDYLTKPISDKTLLPMIEKWLARNGEERPDGREEAGARDAAPVIFDDSRIASLRLAENRNGTLFVDELIETFLLNTALDLSQLRLAAEQGKATDIYRLSHRLKGSSGSLGLLGLEAHFSALEIMGRSGECAGADKLLVLVERDLPASRAALFAQLSSGKQAA